MVAFTILSGEETLGGEWVDQFMLLDQSLSFQEVKMVDEMWCMVQDLVVVLP
jgi:hypothetical protein